ncbi:MAG TPA: SCO family protein [Bryobacteraceae bacterium]|jgi:protein SCO1/2
MKLRFFAFFLILASLVSAQSGTRTDPYRGGLIAPPLPKPNFVLTDTSGAPFDFWKRTQGSVTLLFFGYTFCPDQCPMHMANIGMALKKLPDAIAEQVKLVFVTTDPARDTPIVLRRWLDHFDKHFVGLTGAEAALESVQRAAGVPVARRTEPRTGAYSVAHANFVVAYTKDNLAHMIYPGGVGTNDWVHDLPLLVMGTWSRP